MNKKGFTLTELLGVIVVLAVIIGIAMMASTTIMNKSKIKLYREMEDNLKDAAIDYLLDNRENINFDNATVSVDKLIEDGYFEDDKNYCVKTKNIKLIRTENDYTAIVEEGTCGN